MCSLKSWENLRMKSVVLFFLKKEKRTKEKCWKRIFTVKKKKHYPAKRRHIDLKTHILLSSMATKNRQGKSRGLRTEAALYNNEGGTMWL